jgi:hypothetical protein
MPFLFCVRDVMLLFIYIDAWCMDHFVWRGVEMTMGEEEPSVEHGRERQGHAPVERKPSNDSKPPCKRRPHNDLSGICRVIHGRTVNPRSLSIVTLQTTVKLPPNRRQILTPGERGSAGQSASENQRRRPYKNFAEFCDYLSPIGLGHLNIILPMCYLDVSFLDHCLLSDDNMDSLERQIHSILFLPSNFCGRNGLDQLTDRLASNWRKASVMFRSSGAIFITSGMYSSQTIKISTRLARKEHSSL